MDWLDWKVSKAEPGLIEQPQSLALSKYLLRRRIQQTGRCACRPPSKKRLATHCQECGELTGPVLSLSLVPRAGTRVRRASTQHRQYEVVLALTVMQTPPFILCTSLTSL